MGGLASLASRLASQFPRLFTKEFYSNFNRFFNVNVKSVAGVEKALSKIAPSKETLLGLVNAASAATMAIQLTDLSANSMKQLASAESKELGTTDFTNLIKGLVNVAGELLSDKEWSNLLSAASDILDGNVANNDGEKGVSLEDAYIEVNARKAQELAYVEARSRKMADVALTYKAQRAKLERASAILGVSMANVIELAELLKDIDMSYENVL